jgi:hypothetical protein
MKTTRKMQVQFEGKIKHALAASQHLIIPRAATGTHARPAPHKADGNDSDQSR